MKPCLLLLAFSLSVLLLFAAPIHMVQAQQFVQYKVQVKIDGSAQWTITQASDLNGKIDSWRGFQLRVENLVSLAANLTQRDMSVDPNSLQLNTIWENQSQTTEYQFTWLNFSIVQNDSVIIGDTFDVNGFFSQLYGDGELQIVYPPSCTVALISPQPNGGNNAPNTLDWLGTAFFVNGNPKIVLAPVAPTPSPNQIIDSTTWQFYAIVGIAGAAVASASLVGFYMFRRHKNIQSKLTTTEFAAPGPLIESEEEKILRVLHANGGSAFQSAITEQCRFSKSKTSQLLTVLEKKGTVRRYKKGRDKIVTLFVQDGKCKGD